MLEERILVSFLEMMQMLINNKINHTLLSILNTHMSVKLLWIKQKCKHAVYNHKPVERL